jgi:hypothetical protein
LYFSNLPKNAFSKQDEKNIFTFTRPTQYVSSVIKCFQKLFFLIPSLSNCFKNIWYFLGLTFEYFFIAGRGGGGLLNIFPLAYLINFSTPFDAKAFTKAVYLVINNLGIS